MHTPPGTSLQPPPTPSPLYNTLPRPPTEISCAASHYTLFLSLHQHRPHICAGNKCQARLSETSMTAAATTNGLKEASLALSILLVLSVPVVLYRQSPQQSAPNGAATRAMTAWSLALWRFNRSKGAIATIEGTSGPDALDATDPLQRAWARARPVFDGVEGCHGAENSRDVCSTCNASFVRDFPLGPEAIRRSLVPGDPCPFVRAANKIRAGEQLNISVIGGSMTFGHGCVDGERRERSCAWSSRLAKKLGAILGRNAESSFSVHNLARPGWAYSQWAENVAAIAQVKGTDVVIVDLTVNSQAYKTDYIGNMRSLDMFLQSLHSLQTGPGGGFAVMFVETFRTCAFTASDCDIHCPNRDARGNISTVLGAGTSQLYTWCNVW